MKRCNTLSILLIAALLAACSTVRYEALEQVGIYKRDILVDQVDPVIAVLNDDVLYLRHSLNARALDALRGEATALEGKVDALIRDMQLAIDEADTFIGRLRDG